MDKREIDNRLMASFIDYAVANKVSSEEWGRFIVNHYHDSELEHARRECCRILSGNNDSVSEQDKEYLYALAKSLRASGERN